MASFVKHCSISKKRRKSANSTLPQKQIWLNLKKKTINKINTKKLDPDIYMHGHGHCPNAHWRVFLLVKSLMRSLKSNFFANLLSIDRSARLFTLS